MASKTAAPAPTQKPAATPGTEVATRSTGLTARMAMKFGIEPTTFLTTLKQTAFRQRGKNGQPAVEVSNEQMAMLLHIAEKYDLDPFMKQLYAFPSEGGITPIVPIDGWLAMINRHPQLESMEIEIPEPGTEADDYWTTCIIKRKDRAKPTKITEWLKECYRKTDPWDEMPKRMLRWKAIIQERSRQLWLFAVFSILTRVRANFQQRDRRHSARKNDGWHIKRARANRRRENHCRHR